MVPEAEANVPKGDAVGCWDAGWSAGLEPKLPKAGAGEPKTAEPLNKPEGFAEPKGCADPRGDGEPKADMDPQGDDAPPGGDTEPKVGCLRSVFFVKSPAPAGAAAGVASEGAAVDEVRNAAVTGGAAGAVPDGGGADEVWFFAVPRTAGSRLEPAAGDGFVSPRGVGDLEGVTAPFPVSHRAHPSQT